MSGASASQATQPGGPGQGSNPGLPEHPCSRMRKTAGQRRRRGRPCRAWIIEWSLGNFFLFFFVKLYPHGTKKGKRQEDVPAAPLLDEWEHLHHSLLLACFSASASSCFRFHLVSTLLASSTRRQRLRLHCRMMTRWYFIVIILFPHASELNRCSSPSGTPPCLGDVEVTEADTLGISTWVQKYFLMYIRIF